VIYAFELMTEGVEEDNYPIVTTAQSCIWQKIQGILQADGEGFSNEEGYHILWQFSEDVDGPWNCAVLNAAGAWENFSMELGDKAQQDAFLNGTVPATATLL
jgi:protein-disulfide isomerase-like protein with CxxC motif